MPAPAPGLLPALGGDCPDLRGSYDLALGEGRRRRLPGTVLTDAVKPPHHHSVLSIESSDTAALRLRSWGTDDDLRRGFAAWREDSAYRYALWRDSLEARNAPGGILLQRRSDAAALRAPVDLPRSREFVLDASRYRCANGWIVFDGVPEPDADHADDAEVSLTRAADGGLVATWRFRRDRTFSLWCGDGCTGNVPMPDEHVQHWWHAPPTQPVADSPIDWAAWAADDPRPPEVRNRYVAGRELRYADAGPATAPAASPRTPSPIVAVSVDRPMSTPAANATDEPTSRPAASAGDDAANRWRQHLAPMLAAGSEIVALRCEAQACFVEGRAVAMTDVSTLLRALTADTHATPELMLIERLDDARYRFELQLPAEP